MKNVLNIINNYVSLDACASHLTARIYLGYQFVRRLINDCIKIEKINELAQKNIYQTLSSYFNKFSIKRISQLETNSDKITMGQGEYIVFQKLPSGEKRQLPPEIFEQVYKILIQHSPAVSISSGAERSSERCANRYELIKAELKKIDSTLEVFFVPKTLYELIFIRKCIKEDLNNKKICHNLAPLHHTVTLEDFEGDQQKYENYLNNKNIRQKKEKCWHLCYFTDSGDNEHIGVKNVAYRLNKAIFKEFDPSNEGFTFQEFSAFTEKEIEFLKAHYKTGLEITEKLRRGEKVEKISSTSTPGPTTNFGYELSSIPSMGIRNEADAQIIRSAIALDCSKIAQHSLFLYRGADFQKDSIFCWSDKNKPYSLSYGSSLFAGCIYDGGATAFYYMRKGENAYAIPVPFDQLSKSPFFVPTTHTVAQLFGDGEIFHARTMCWKDFDPKNLEGMDVGANGHIRNHLQSNLTKEELNTYFEEYKNQAFQLK